MMRSCQIQTPIEYIRTMLDEVGYLTNLSGKRVLENSCGEGNILAEIVQRYISDSRKQGFTTNQIKYGLMSDIVGYEIDQTCVTMCINKLNKILDRENIPRIKWNIKNVDYLCSCDNEFDYVIGNPPYITYHDLTYNEREYLKHNFLSCRKGRFDYYYAFVEKSYHSLKIGGKLVYLVPFSIFRNKFAEYLRNLIQDDIVTVLDYSGIKIFDRVTTSSAIIVIQKGANQKFLQYTQKNNKKTMIIEKIALQKKWFFVTGTGKKRFGDYYSVQNSIATLCNDAFLIKKYIDSNEYIEVDGYRVEKGIIKPAVSTKSCKYRNHLQTMIIFPYKFNEEGYVRYTEEELRKVFPEGFLYLRSFWGRLLKRKINHGVQWFEYGRTQALKNIQGEKLIIPMVITSKVTTYIAKEDDVPYAGYFIKSKSEYSLQFAKELLENSRFFEYVKEKGTPTTKMSYRISVKEIENFPFE